MKKTIISFLLVIAVFLIASCKDDVPTSTVEKAVFQEILDYPNSSQDDRYALVHTETTLNTITEYCLYFIGYKDERGQSHRGDLLLLIKQKNIESEDWQNIIYYTGNFEALSNSQITRFAIAQDNQYGNRTEYYERFTPIVLKFNTCTDSYSLSQYDGSFYIDWHYPIEELPTHHHTGASKHKGRTVTFEISDAFEGPYSALAGFKTYTITWLPPNNSELDQYRENSDWSVFFYWLDHRYEKT